MCKRMVYALKIKWNVSTQTAPPLAPDESSKKSRRMNRIAIMQPYFLPYAGYFRLLVDVEAFVVGDVQQFPRRGWVHRNRLIDDQDRLGWLTLPVRPQPLDTQIRDIGFADGAQTTLNRNMARFAACRTPNTATEPILEAL